MLPILKVYSYIFLFLNSLMYQLLTAGSKNDDLYTSIISLEHVLKVEKILIENLQNYIDKSEEDIKSIKRLIQDNHVTGPELKSTIHQKLKSVLKNPKDYLEKCKEIYTVHDAYIPQISDLNGIISGLVRLQRIYGFTANHIADGKLSENIHLPAKFTSEDCLYVALQLCEMEIYEYALEWYTAALDRLNRKEIRFFKSHDQVKEKLIRTLQEHSQISTDSVEVDEKIGVDILELLQTACRGEYQKSSEELAKLYCKYETENHPFLKLAPIKVEVMNLLPYLVVFPEAIYESEIKIIKEMSKNKLERAEVWSTEEGKELSTNYRTSKHTWMDNESHPIMHKLNQRMYDMTGLTMETSEPLQIANYGIGGHYDFHHDYAEESDDPKYNSTFDDPYGSGNRIATILFYLSDVPLGGATVFPYLGTRIFPEKGSATFWYNLHSSLIGNSYTLHSSCPVVLGSKWAANKWIRSEGQLFRKPCLNEYDHEIIE